MTHTITLDEAYSTTRVVTKDKPEIINQPEGQFETVLFLPEGENRQGEGGLRTKGYYKKSYPNKPLISIITVVYNGEKYLEETIQSVLNQTYDNVEYIIIDGGSTDGTLDIIRKYEDAIDYWISEKDNGIYDAWNKGLKLSTGTILGFLNADDYYDKSTLQSIVIPFSKTLIQIVYGYTQFLSDSQCGKIHASSFNPNKIENGFGFMHTSVFTTQKVYKKIGLFDDFYKIAGDVDWMLRAYLEKIPFHQHSHTNYMRDGGISDKLEDIAFKEYTLALKKYDFSKNKIHFAILKRKIIRFIDKTIGLKNAYFIKYQIYLLILCVFNFMYNYLPFFIFKKQLLKFFSIYLGSNSYIHTPVRLFSKGRISIGNNSTINHNCYLDNRGNIKIGNNVSIAHGTKIYTAGHRIDCPCFSYLVKNVTIGDNVVIFANAMIMPGCKIGNNAVILAGSVVTKDVEINSVVGGNPAQHIRFRETNDFKYKLNYSYWFAQ